MMRPALSNSQPEADREEYARAAVRRLKSVAGKVSECSAKIKGAMNRALVHPSRRRLSAVPESLAICRRSHVR